MVNTFRHMLSYIDAIHFYCGMDIFLSLFRLNLFLYRCTGPFLHVEIEMSERRSSGLFTLITC